MIQVVNFKFKLPESNFIINATSRSNNWSMGLSPFICGPADLYDGYKSINIENLWQYSKVYSEYLNTDGNPSAAYFKWAQDGWNSKKANRYPMGRGAIPEYSWWDGEKLGYVEARKRIYIPKYSEAVRQTDAFKQLADIYKRMPKNKILYLLEFDAHNMPPGSFDYWDFWNNPNIKMGHSYVLAMMLEGLL